MVDNNFLKKIILRDLFNSNFGGKNLIIKIYLNFDILLFLE